MPETLEETTPGNNQDVDISRTARSYRRYDQATTDAVARLKQRFFMDRAETFLGLYELIRTEDERLCSETGFASAVAFTWDHWDSFLKVAESPIFTYWVSILTDLIEPYGRKGLISSDLEYHLAAAGMDRAGLLRMHLDQFRVFALATAVLAKGTLQFAAPLDLAYPWLPGMLSEWVTNEGGADPAQVRGCDGGVPVFVGLPRHPRSIPSARSGEASLCVHANAAPFHLKHVERWHRLTKHDDWVRFASTLTEAMELTERVVPGLSRQLALVASTCVPMTTEGVTPMASGSYTRLFGTLFLADTEDPVHMAEMLIHEFCHNKLTLLEETARFFQVPTSTVRCHYSPWRDTLRSSAAVLHALFVHIEILRFWLALHVAPTENEHQPLVLRRIWTLIGQLQFGIHDLRQTGQFTEIGMALLNDIELDLRAWVDSAPQQNEEARPFFSEMKTDLTLSTLPISEALARHRDTLWNSIPPGRCLS